MTAPIIEEDIWDPNARFSLSVREITSVSATFILSADPSLSDFSWDEEEDDALSMPGGPLTASGSQYTNKPDRVIPDALAKGLSVLVNGQPWQRVLMRVDDTADEAIVIIYGLMPGRRYDIELGVAPGDESIRGQVTTEQNTHPDLSPVDGDSSPEEDESTLAGSADSSPSANTNALPLAPTIEERVQQFQHSLSQLTDERNTLTASLKSTRRDAQKTDAALRADIEGLKRASEKQAAGEHRARQKILALQEAVKQATAATATTEEEVAQIERELPSLKAALEEKEREHEQSRVEADKIRAEREHAEADARRRTDASKAEVLSIANRLERLTTRRDKLETGVIADLEEQLRAVREEMEHIESDPFGYLYRLDEEQNAAAAAAPDELGEPGVAAVPGHPLARQSPNLTRQFGMSPGPIQRPHSQGTVSRTAQPVSPSTRVKDATATRRTRQAPSTLAAATGSKPANSSSSSSALRPAGSVHIASQANTTLSGRAAPFEPRRGATTALNPASTAFEPKSILVNPNRVKVPSRAVKLT